MPVTPLPPEFPRRRTRLLAYLIGVAVLWVIVVVLGVPIEVAIGIGLGGVVVPHAVLTWVTKGVAPGLAAA
jgi:hypothetical protein